MSRLAFFIVIFSFILLVFLGLNLMKTSYKILPVNPTADMAYTPFETWQDYRSPEGNFVTQFPTLPQRATDNIVDPRTRQMKNYDMYVSEQADGKIFMVSVVTLPKGEAQFGEDVLNNVVSDMLSANPSNELKEVNKGTFLSYPSLDFTVENSSVEIKTKAFTKQNILYILSGVLRKGAYDEGEFQHFINSFQLTSEETKE